MIFLVILRSNLDSFLRCHESARIFCNVLKRYGYNVEVQDGFYVRNEKELLHSWVEFFDLYVTKIIETTPQQVFPKLFAEELSKSLVVSQDDERFIRYCPIPAEKFSEFCKIRDIQIDENQVKCLSEVIFQSIKDLPAKKKKDNAR